MLTPKQKHQFFKDGYLQLKGCVPRKMIECALKHINQNLGSVGMNREDIPKMSALSYCEDVQKIPQLTDLFNESKVYTELQSLVGKNKVDKVPGTQIALRFPKFLDQGQAPKPRGHLDGIGEKGNSVGLGNYKRSFTCLAVIYLSDVPRADMGNFTVWPGSHRVAEDFFKEHGTEIMRQGQPNLGLKMKPKQLTGKAGDVILAHHQLTHAPSSNLSPHIRYAAITRFEHKACRDFGNQAFTDIWHEWEGLHDGPVMRRAS